MRLNSLLALIDLKIKKQDKRKFVENIRYPAENVTQTRKNLKKLPGQLLYIFIYIPVTQATTYYHYIITNNILSPEHNISHLYKQTNSPNYQTKKQH